MSDETGKASGAAPAPARLVSVVVPTFNRPATLTAALQSIRAIEGPNLPFEIIVGDNGRTAETRAVAEQFGAVYLEVPVKGAGAARNAGLRRATGEFIAFLDDDDVWLPQNVRAQLAALDAHPEWEGVIGQAITTDPDLLNPSEPWPEAGTGTGDELVRRMLSGLFPQIGTLLVRSHVREAIGEFDEALLGGQDLDWQLRIARRRTLGFVPVPCLLFRGRAHGSYDRLQLMRVHFDRKVFLRHALPEWRVWPSPVAFMKGYAGTLQHFYWYFVTVAIDARKRGDRKQSLTALRGAFTVFPLRAFYHMIRIADFRRTLYP